MKSYRVRYVGHSTCVLEIRNINFGQEASVGEDTSEMEVYVRGQY
jgi:hypothetical protein